MSQSTSQSCPSHDLPSDADDVAAFETANAAVNNVKSELNRLVFGQSDVVDQLLACILAGGHALLVGPPGTGKTRLVSACAKVLGLETNRIQFTPDLMPADILGAEILDIAPDGTRAFRFIEGPIFTRLLMADEINRASPRTQSALLQAMQEYHVTIAGQRRDLAAPFHVLATQNPIEQEGTYPLPEAQLDRFLMQINIGYPDKDAERDMLAATTQATDVTPQTVLSADALIAAQALVRRMPVSDRLVDAILDITHRARPQSEKQPTADADRAGIGSFLSWGAGPRASQSLSLGARALALIDGRHAPSLDDLKRLAPPVLRHRLSPNFRARSVNKSVDDLIHAVLGGL